MCFSSNHQFSGLASWVVMDITGLFQELKQPQQSKEENATKDREETVKANKQDLEDDDYDVDVDVNKETGGLREPEPTRFDDWERNDRSLSLNIVSLNLRWLGFYVVVGVDIYERCVVVGGRDLGDGLDQGQRMVASVFGFG
ncbi:hypothetical protein EZV62_019767 [Acer yangbiense]|uniref:Succinate dehydrogenase assembly factor 4, mitochondrial n=1 Tax=Acer yangbiense TaxID=1000413 RepID=A0A5C7HC63_9ROSI|nr:hypothetical protein EZV62_019767 [Acer yangbiense]